MFDSSRSETEEHKFKQRLVGALVLIALAVIIIPLILDFRKGYDRVIEGTNIPPKPDDFRVEVVPLTPPGDTSIKEPGEAPSGEPAPDLPMQTSEPEITPEPVVAAPPKAAMPESPAKAAKTTEAGKPAEAAAVAEVTGWVVQLGSFTNKQNAEDLYKQLQKKGYKAFIDEVKVEGKMIQRVRIGPLEKKSGAEAIRDKLAADMKLDAIVQSYP